MLLTNEIFNSIFLINTFCLSSESISLAYIDARLVHLLQSFIMSMNPAISPALEIVNSDLTAMSSTITTDKEESDVSVSCGASADFDGAKLCSIEAEMVVKHLRQTRIQVLNLADGDLRFKNLLDALIKVVVEEFYCLPEERDLLTELASRKAYIMFLSFVLWILAVAAVFLFTSGVKSSSNEPPPT